MKGHECLTRASILDVRIMARRADLKFLKGARGEMTGVSIHRTGVLFVILQGKPLRLGAATSCGIDLPNASRCGLLSRCLQDTHAELMIVAPAIRGRPSISHRSSIWRGRVVRAML
jgi:hypothetical protein